MLLCYALGLGWSWALSALDPGGEAGLLETWGEGQLKKIPERKNGARLGGTEDARLGLPKGVSAREGVRRGPGGGARAGPAQRTSSLGLCRSFPQPPPGRRAAGVSSPWGSLLPLACGQPRSPEVGVSRQVSPSASMCRALVTSLETQASEAGGGAAASQDQEGVVEGSRGRPAWEGARGWDTARTLSADLGGRDSAISYQ